MRKGNFKLELRTLLLHINLPGQPKILIAHIQARTTFDSIECACGCLEISRINPQSRELCGSLAMILQRETNEINRILPTDPVLLATASGFRQRRKGDLGAHVFQFRKSRFHVRALIRIADTKRSET